MSSRGIRIEQEFKQKTKSKRYFFIVFFKWEKIHLNNVKNCRTLVLDESFFPVGVISWQRAISLMFLNKGKVIEVYEDFKVRSTTKEFQVPKIIRIFKKVKIHEIGLKLNRKNIYRRDHYLCAYCNGHFLSNELSLDHITPVCQGGKDTWDNLISSCRPCNNKKAGRTPEQANMKLHFKAKKPRWSFVMALNVKKHEIDIWKKWIF